MSQEQAKSRENMSDQQNRDKQNVNKDKVGDNGASKEAENTKGPDDSATTESEGRSVGEATSATPLGNMESLSEYLAQSLGIRERPPSKLDSFDLAGIAKFLASDECKNVVTMAGAGISTSAGIPDFRTPGTGLYDNLAAYNLPEPTAVFSIDFFRENPKPFFTLAKELYPGSFKPTPCHYFINLLNKKGKLLRHFTQNIDTLERVAGLESERIIEAHGTFHTGHCLDCRKEYTQDWMKEEIFADKIPTCTDEGCEGIVKPDIVFFGENLPESFVKAVGGDLPKCDLLIVMGTSLQVQPFASLVSRVPLATPRLYINLEKGPSTSNPITALFFGGSFEFDSDHNYRDVFKEAKCDDGCQELADLLGWGEELKAMVASEHAKIDKTNAETAEKAAKPAKAAKSAKSAVKSQKSVPAKLEAKGGKKEKF